MSGNHIRYIGVTGLIFVFGFIAACGGNASSAGRGAATREWSLTATAVATVAPSFTATAVVTVAPTIPAPVVAAAPTKASNPGSTELSDEEVLARGKLIFEKTAGGVGCAMCHGMDAMGDPAQAAPPNIGASAEVIEQALFDRPQMSFISLTVPEVKAVAAYLQWLKEQQ